VCQPRMRQVFSTSKVCATTRSARDYLLRKVELAAFLQCVVKSAACVIPRSSYARRSFVRVVDRYARSRGMDIASMHVTHKESRHGRQHARSRQHSGTTRSENRERSRSELDRPERQL